MKVDLMSFSHEPDKAGHPAGRRLVRPRTALKPYAGLDFPALHLLTAAHTRRS
jgi:hypothetical protein